MRQKKASALALGIFVANFLLAQSFITLPTISRLPPSSLCGSLFSRKHFPDSKHLHHVPHYYGGREHHVRRVPLQSRSQSPSQPGPALQVQASVNSEGGKQDREVLIIGGGPVGLACALALNRIPDFKVTIVERSRPGDENILAWFPYAIDKQFQQFIEEMGFLSELKAAGVQFSQRNRTVVYNATASAKQGQSLGSLRMLRQDLTGVLRRACDASGVTVLDGYQLKSISRTGGERDQAVLCTTIQETNNNEGSELSFTPWLLVGADGKNSEVREVLAAWAREDRTNRDANAFDLQLVPCYSSGKLVKTLPITAEQLETLSPWTSNYVFQPLEETPSRKLFAELFRMQPGRSAPLNILVDDRTHALFTDPHLQTVSGMRSYLAAQLPWLCSRVHFSDSQLSTFIQSKEVEYPPALFAGDASFHLRGSSDSSDQRGGAGASSEERTDTGSLRAEAGVVVLGDALHCVPPDLGKGVNAGIRDVQSLQHALAALSGPASSSSPSTTVVSPSSRAILPAGSTALESALLGFSAKVVLEAKALCYITATASRFSDSAPAHSLLRLLFNLDVLLRSKLSRLPLLGGTLFAPPLVVLIYSEGSFARAWSRTRSTTLAIAAFALGALTLIFSFVAFLAAAVAGWL